MVAVIAHLYGCKAIDAATVYSLLEHLQSRWAIEATVPESQATPDTSPSYACLLRVPCVDHKAAEVMRAGLPQYQCRASVCDQACWECRFSEQDVALVFSLLSIAGFQLRSDDPCAMKVRIPAL